jgi:lipopolysaccharide transport system permease protein
MNPNQPFSTSFGEMFASFWRNRSLVVQMVQREVVGRYRGSLMGMAWSFFNPLLMLVIFTFVFSVVFKARWSLVENDKVSFAIIIFVGLIVHGVLAECINRAPTLVLSNVNYVKKVIFPIEMLPWVAFGSAFFHAMVSLIVLLGAQLLLDHHLPWTAIFFPIVLLPLFFITMGLSWFLSALGVYMRDIVQFVAILSNVLFYLSPVIYPVSALPEQYQPWMRANPLTFVIEEGRKTLIYGEIPDFASLSLITVIGLIVAWVGFVSFQKSRRGFADVL